MTRPLAATRIEQAIQALVASGRLPVIPNQYLPAIDIQDTKQPEHGDLACSWAMAAAKPIAGAGGPSNPRALADLIAEELRLDPTFSRVDVAGPGFINLTFAQDRMTKFVQAAVDSSKESVLSGAHFARPQLHRPLKVNLEFVSVNPNGPITIGSGRGAAFGSALANVMEAAGHTVQREYYINDGVNSEQMRLFAESVKAMKEGLSVPENGYKGDYVQEVASAINDSSIPQNADVAWFQSVSQAAMISKQRADLSAFGVEFDTWFSEQSLHDSGKVLEEVSALVAKGAADDSPTRTVLKMAKGGVIEEVIRESQDVVSQRSDEQDDDAGSGSLPTLWLRSTLFGDDMDRVLRRKDGRLTYIASDVAYHQDKFERPVDADKLITVLGPDHHGYIGRLHAVVAADLMTAELGTVDATEATWVSEAERELYKGDFNLRLRCQKALAESRERLLVLIFQLVRFVKDGKPAPMRKRDGNIYALIDLINEIGSKVRPQGTLEEKQSAGKDVARFFYLMRHHDTTFDFDLDLAARQSDENPVFYVQYAHARVCSVIEKALQVGFNVPDTVQDPPALSGIHAKERALVLKIADLSYEIERCSVDYGVNRLTTYAVDLARLYHAFYDSCRVINASDSELTAWRLAICQATRVALKAVFDVLGIHAPERMEREETEGPVNKL